MARTFSQSTVNKCVYEQLTPAGYDVEVLEDVLVDGYVCCPPEDRKNWKLIIFLPVYINEWNSGLELHQYKDWSTVPKAIKNRIEQYRTEETED